MRLKAFKINTGQVLIHFKQSMEQPFGPERNLTALGQALGNSSLPPLGCFRGNDVFGGSRSCSAPQTPARPHFVHLMGFPLRGGSPQTRSTQPPKPHRECQGLTSCLKSGIWSCCSRQGAVSRLLHETGFLQLRAPLPTRLQARCYI